MLKLLSPSICSYMYAVAHIHTMSFLKIKHFLLISLVTAMVSLRVNDNIIPCVMFNFNCRAQNLLSITISNGYTMVFLKVKLIILFIILFTSNVICQIMTFAYLLVSLSFHSTILINYVLHSGSDLTKSYLNYIVS